MNLLDHFPKQFAPRPAQTESLQRISTAFNSGKKFVICCAPTGSGKSLISKTIGNSAPLPSDRFVQLVRSYRAYAMDDLGDYTAADDCIKEPAFGCISLTITKSLQDQYKTMFDDAEVLKGKTNYQCKIDPTTDVDGAPCVLTPRLKQQCWSNNICPYYNARNDTLTAQFAVLNYSMFHALPEHLKKRKYIVCDEASELEEEIVRQFTCQVDVQKLRQVGLDVKIPRDEMQDTFFNWVVSLKNNVSIEIESIIGHAQKKEKLTIIEKKKLQFFQNLHRKLSDIEKTWNDCEYICQRNDTIVFIQPFKVNKLASYIFKHADHVLLMSATIVDPENFAKTLGITNYEYVEVSNSFDPKKAPIYVSTETSLNHQNLETSLPKIAKLVKKLCTEHKKEKGIIHTHTFHITKFLQNYLTGDRFLFRDSENINEEILKAHNDSPEPTVLVSPSMMFGVDLKDDLARFQIVVKAAYPPLGNLRIKRMFDEDKQWYTDKMLTSLIQSCGRGIRTVDDHCVTYILDGAIVKTVINNKHRLPKYFIDRFV